MKGSATLPNACALSARRSDSSKEPDMPGPNSHDFDLIDRLAEEFAARYRRGERPSVQEYADRYPHLAAQIRELLPAMVEIEQAGDEMADETAAAPVPALAQLGDFHILREVGHGGMGVVYEAEQVSLGRRVALKVLTQKTVRDAKQRARFEREAKAAARLHHTNIVPVYGVGEHEGTPYYVMQFIQGLGLDEVIMELSRMASGGTAPGANQTSTRRSLSARLAAQSLMTGQFRTGSNGVAIHAAIAPTIDGPAVSEAGFCEAGRSSSEPRVGDPRPTSQRPATEGPARESPISGSGHAVAVRRADTSGLTSSVTLPGQSESGTGRKSRKLTYWQSVARVGVQVADALEHAHKQGVVHRDVKPSNLLLDLEGTVWVTDFGLAKADDRQNLTHTGDILGTLRYMPPEAFEGRADARGDIYALGLTLYELLALRPAFDESDRHRLIKQVTDVEPPPLRKVRKDIPKDLETIVHKAIDREPRQRYQTAAEFAADMQRYLDDEPIQARRLTRRELAWRWCRRNPAVASLTAAIAALLVAISLASVGAAAHFDRLARQARQLADEERDAKEREAEQRATAEANFAKARQAVDDYFTKVSESQLLTAPGLQPLRRDLLQAALRYYQGFLKERADDAAIKAGLAAAYLRVGQILGELGGKVAERDAAHRQGFALYQELTREDPANSEYLNGMAIAHRGLGRHAKAVAIWERVVRPDDIRYMRNLAGSHNSVALDYSRGGRIDEALESHLKAMAVEEQLVRLAPDDAEGRSHLSGTINNIANILGQQGRHREALALYRQAVEHSEVAFVKTPQLINVGRYLSIQLRNVAINERRFGNTDAAVAAYRRAVDVLRRLVRDNPSLPGPPRELFNYTEMFGTFLHDLGRADESLRLAQEARTTIEEIRGTTPEYFQDLARIRVVCAGLLGRGKADLTPAERAARDKDLDAAVTALRQMVAAGRLAGDRIQGLKENPVWDELRARPEFVELVGRAEEMARGEPAPAPEGPAKTPATAADTTNRRGRATRATAYQAAGLVHLERGQHEVARRSLQQALELRKQLSDEDPTDVQAQADLTASRLALGDLDWATGRMAAGLTFWRAVLDELAAHPGAAAAVIESLVDALPGVAQSLARRGLWAEAADYLDRVNTLFPPTPASHPTGDRYAMLHDLFWVSGNAEGRRRTAERLFENYNASDNSVAMRNVLRRLPPAADQGRVDGLIRKLSEKPGTNRDADALRALGVAELRSGRFERAVNWFEKCQTMAGPAMTRESSSWFGLAVARHRQQRVGEAHELYDKAARQMEHAIPLPTDGDFGAEWWSDWLYREMFRQEAAAELGLPVGRYPRLHLVEGVARQSLGQADAAEAAFRAAVETRPDDPAVWLERSMAFVKLGLADRAGADLAEAHRRQAAPGRAADAGPWIAYGRFLAERSEHPKADEFFAKAAAMAGNAPKPFLDAGWWAAGPYPADFTLVCPPERGTDPGRPVYAVHANQEYRWKTRTVTADGEMFVPGAGRNQSSTEYAMAYVYATTERTAVLTVGAVGPARVWLNDRLVYLARVRQGGAREVRVPITLRPGRNTLLIRVNLPRAESYRLIGKFEDQAALAKFDPATAAFDAVVAAAPDDSAARLARGHRLGELGRWPEADVDFGKAVELNPQEAQVWRDRGRHYAELGQWDKAAADYSKALDLAPVPSRELPKSGGNVMYPWFRDRAGIEEGLVRWEEVFNRVVRLRPNDDALWARRTVHLALSGRWQEAAAASARAMEIKPDDYNGWYVRATLAIQAGDRADYQAVCQNVLKHLGGATDRRVTDCAAWACLLAPGAVADLAPVIALSDVAVSGAEALPLYPWFAFHRAMADVRAGSYARAAERLEASPAFRIPHMSASKEAAIAIAYYHLGRLDEARQALAGARATLDRSGPDLARGQPYNFPGASWWDWLHAQFLVREAEALVGAGNGS
jgi:serine/threonine protein kinase/tetratricopeptide (TPR) repeat protein